ncbi:MAG TPA: hypothetical protein VE476_14220 [Propionibacteriaceae bacterium]|jgi:hypothetical protein|nr:hypothetical protein [Propionibacteriaceae bacterium]
MAAGELGTTTTNLPALRVIGGVVEILRGVKAEGQALESIARPLTAHETDDDATPATA